LAGILRLMSDFAVIRGLKDDGIYTGMVQSLFGTNGRVGGLNRSGGAFAILEEFSRG